MRLFHAIRRRLGRSDAERARAETVRAAYTAIRGREPDNDEMTATLQRLRTETLSPDGLLAELAGQRPAGETQPDAGLAGLPDPLGELPETVRARARSLENMTELSAAAFARAWQETFPNADELVIGQRDYLRTHQRRFRELFNAVIALTGQTPRILEIGTSEASRLYRTFRPSADIVTADRPVAHDYIGFTPEKSRRIASARTHVAIDLETDDPKTHAGLGAAGPFDLIVFTEVLEHLITPPAQLIAGLLSQLAPDGTLYLTTPNFLSRANRAAIAAGRNPQPIYPGESANWDRHHHFREYTMRELLDLVAAAGGEVYTAYYSACWDTDEADTSPPGPAEADQRANLVVLARRARGAADS